MVGLQTNWKKKLRKALKRVGKVVIMDIRRQLDQQRKWKAEVVKRTAAWAKAKKKKEQKDIQAEKVAKQEKKAAKAA